jgi:hypothetical protein
MKQSPRHDFKIVIAKNLQSRWRGRGMSSDSRDVVAGFTTDKVSSLGYC